MSHQPHATLKLTYVLLSPTFGMHQYTADMANRMAACGHQVRLVTTSGCPRDRYAPAVDIDTPFTSTGTGFSPEGARLRDYRRVCSALALPTEVGRAAVHFTGVHLWNLPLVWALRRRGVPVVHTLHDLDPHYGRRFGGLIRLWNRLLVSTGCHLLVHGRRYRDRLLAQGVPAARVTYTPLLHLFLGYQASRAAEPLAKDVRYEPWALFFGRLLPYKGVGDLVQAQAMLDARGGGGGVTLAGSGDLGRVWEDPLPSGVILRNRLIEDEEALDLFCRCGLLVLPYRDATQSALVAAAYYFRKPVVVTEAGALPELVYEGVTGWVVPPANPYALANCLNEALSDPERLAGMGANGRLWYDAQRRAEWEMVLTMYEGQEQSIGRPGADPGDGEAGQESETMSVDAVRESELGGSMGEGAVAKRGRIHPPSLRLRVSERKLLLLLLDVLIVNLALVVALVVWTGFSVSPRTLLLNSKWFVTLTAEWLGCAVFFGCYDLDRSATTWPSLSSSGAAALASVGVYALTPWLTPALGSRGLLATFAGLAVTGVLVWRAIYAELFVQPWFKQRALVVGAGWAGRTLVSALRLAPEGAPNPFRGTGYQVVGFVDDDPSYCGTRVSGMPVVGDSANLVALAQDLQVDEVILAITHRHAVCEQLFDALLRCRELGFRVTTMSTLYERLLGRVPVEHIGHDLHMVVQMHETAGERSYLVLKRVADLLMALCGLAVLAVLTPLVALANASASPGPLLYRQRRVGKGGEIFEMLKFRTMEPNAEQQVGPVWAGERDERVTPVGRLLRHARLDELPQCMNVLRGDMSVIGPRPERPEFVEELAEALPFYRARHAVRPGITGWAQIQYRYARSVDDARVKLEYDIYYVKHANPLLDIRIILQTIPIMAGMKGS